MKSENQLHSITSLSKLWDGKEISRIRSGSDHLTLYGKRTSTHLMIQPAIAHVSLENQTFKSQGIWSRFLFAWPESKIGWRTAPLSDAADIEDVLAYRSFHERVTALLSSPSLTHPEDRLQLMPPLLTLSAEAKIMLRQFYERVEIAQRDGEAFCQIRGFASKAVEHAARIAGVMTVFDNEASEQIKADVMRNAIELLDWYLLETVRLLDAGPVPSDQRDAKALLDWLQSKWHEETISIRQILRYGPNRFRSSACANPLVSILERHGWLEREAAATAALSGRRAAPTWRIVSED
ncbi:hypothetical protein ROA7450_04197 [Roseovarius albus]|uniref:DUF3987 domain-containing protein n=1 Tax=Roseovarius albus TaxID=1247867 RepID=A0A1X7AA22_9RHOB|nr:DUF3987 domain-containing protein [Roseovarius albus]SLN74072.1 hypothetical protein ROA7450_04197 [Roseovarius albus]